MRNAYWKVFWTSDRGRGDEPARVHKRQRVCTRIFPSFAQARAFAGGVPQSAIALWINGVLLRTP
jgi:hypothetical protein